jgi:hypothetical protein
VAQNGKASDCEGILRETGDRWKLDTLIPNSDRLLAPSQIPRTSKPTVACEPVLVRGTVNLERTYHTPVYSRTETALDKNKRMRLQYSGDEPLEGDILL